jgi:hypothetical protein
MKATDEEYAPAAANFDSSVVKTFRSPDPSTLAISGQLGRPRNHNQSRRGSVHRGTGARCIEQWL